MKRFYLPLLLATVSVYGMDNEKLDCTTLPKSAAIDIPASKIPKIVVGYATQLEEQGAQQGCLYHEYPGSHSPVYFILNNKQMELNPDYFKESSGTSGSC